MWNIIRRWAESFTTRNAHATDAFYGDCQCAQGWSNSRAQQFKLFWPTRVVVFNDDGRGHSNCLRNSASCCWTSVSSRRRLAPSASRRARGCAGGGTAWTEVAAAVAAADSRSSIARETVGSNGSPENKCMYRYSLVPGWRARMHANGGSRWARRSSVET